MRAMQLRQPRTPLVQVELPDRVPERGEILIDLRACGVCRTDLHVVDGELDRANLPVVPGHEIVGRVAALGRDVSGLEIGERVGVGWLGSTDGTCPYCLMGRENLCDRPLFTGYTRDGGYATAVIADARFVFPLGEQGTDASLAPLMCAGLIGWRALSIAVRGLAGEAPRLGLYGFGAAAHILAQVARWQGRSVFAFTRRGDSRTQEFARTLGAVWAGASEDAPPEPLDAAIIFAPIGELVPLALQAVRKGGRVVCAGIHMSDIPAMPYRLLWEERELLSVANLTRKDGAEFLELAPRIGIATRTTPYPLDRANEALADLRAGRFEGAAVLLP
jgi:propanol-preferring alcohol dehydrogenase